MDAQRTRAGHAGRRAWTTAALCVAASLAPGLIGCDNGNGKSQAADQAYGQGPLPPELRPQDRPPIPDVPVPVGFKEDEGRNRTLHTGVGRFVDHLYKGRKDKHAVVRFYKEQMPVSRWTYVTYMQTRGEHTLEFEKGAERCRIVVRKGDWLYPTYIDVRVWTVGRIDTPRRPNAKGD